MKQKQSGFGLIGIIVIIAVIALVGALGFVGYKNIFSKKDATGQFGEYGYIPNGKPFPPLVAQDPYVPAGLTDQETADYMTRFALVPGLSDALEAIAKNNPCSVTEGRFKQKVLGVTEDKTQALIGNGCGSTGYLRSFMIKQQDKWVRVGASSGKFNDTKEDYTNFSALLDMPSCELVDKYSIQKSLAPVCFKKSDGQSGLYAGDNSNYSYVLR